ncbi:hypothetical protein [Desulfovibrio piger]|uniref:hypothetical protein n=3 Tax=Desulfovibrio piger TaxID=901 RepID=UPI00242B9F53|nr:hypothetical protein [Desulfovibrio piger]MCI6940121.1 hypothetical protein [Desulfovibrio piger]
MIEENFLIFQAPKECITWPCAWIRTPNNKDIHKGPIKIAYHKKNCYIQCKTFDNTYSNYTSYENIMKGCSKDYVILISEHYRDILGITKDDITTSKNFNEQHCKNIYGIKKYKLKISYPQNKIEKYIYHYKAAWQHPDIYAKTSMAIGVLSLFFGIFGLILGLFSIDVFSNLLPPKNSLPRNIYIFSLGGFTGYICTHLFSEKITKETWAVLIILLFMVSYLILYISQYS